MRALIQEACQGAVRDVVAGQAARLASLSEEDLRPVNLRDFQARPANPARAWAQLAWRAWPACRRRTCGPSACATFTCDSKHYQTLGPSWPGVRSLQACTRGPMRTVNLGDFQARL